MPKSPDAFRTISEVADWLGVQAHVLRFWESKFAQVKPIKRAGGRRYYRPNDMMLLGGLKQLLHEDGMTIKGAQKLLREKGVAFVADLSPPLDDLTMAVIEGDLADTAEPMPAPTDDAGPEEVSAADAPAADAAEVGPEPETEPDTLAEPEPIPEAAKDTPEELAPDIAAEPNRPEPLVADALPTPAAEPAPVNEDETDAVPAFRARPRDPVPEEITPEPEHEAEQAVSTEPEQTQPPKPHAIDVPEVPPAREMEVSPSALSALARIRRLTGAEAQEIKPLLARLTRLHASMSSPRKDIRKD